MNVITVTRTVKRTANKKSREFVVDTLFFAIIVAISAWSVLGAVEAIAQRNYDPKTVETVQGKVVSVEKPPSKARGTGVHLILQTDKETIEVHLGPAWYVEKQSPHVEANDTVTVTGSRVTIDGKPAIIAEQVSKGNETLKLRDENGIPAWRSARRHNP